ncbi:MAG: hypothetical protein NVS2B7_00890 [Herpetosiphon sp.]
MSIIRPGLPNFPVIWEHPLDARLDWTLNRAELPRPITPLTYDYVQQVFEHSFNRVAQVYDLPLRARVKHINTYCYWAMVPVGMPPESVLRALSRLRHVAPHPVDALINAAMRPRTKRIQATLDAAMARLGTLWHAKLLPEVRAHFDWWEAFDLSGATLPALRAHLDETIVRTRRLWEIHFQIVFPTQTALSMFTDFYDQLWGGVASFDAYQLLQGFDNKIRQSDRALWELSRQAKQVPVVREALQARPLSSVLMELERSLPGQRFLHQLRSFLHEYGRRGDQLFELSKPSWVEDPNSVIQILKTYITQPDHADADALARAAASREQALAAVRSRLRQSPAASVRRFERMLTAAQAAMVIAQDHHWWIDLRGPYAARRVLLECGRRLVAAGVLQQPNDIFYLTLAELRAALAEQSGVDRHKLVAGRCAEFVYFSTITAPTALGTAPSLPPPHMSLLRAVGRVLGEPPPMATATDIVRGSAGAPGIARGRARVIRSLDEATRVEKGDVLVIESSAPLWTPLFALAAAVVTDAGGSLSHAAVIAREYSIPAVVGTGIATSTISDGQLLAVDGDAGVVRILS